MSPLTAEQIREQELADQENIRARELEQQRALLKKINADRRRQQTRPKNKNKKGGIANKVDEAKDIIEKIKKIQKVIDGIKISSFTLTSCGDIFVSVWVFLIVAHVEWFVSSFVWPIYEIPWWKKMLVVMADLIVMVIFILAYIGLEILTNPAGIIWQSITNYLADVWNYVWSSWV